MSEGDASETPAGSRRKDVPRKKGVVDVWTLVFVAVFVGAMIYRMVTGC